CARRSGAAMPEAIRTRGLSYRAGRGAGSFELSGLDLSVPAGSIYGFLGPNGSGKTTTIRLLMGMMRPRGGEIQVLGHEYPRGIPAALARVGYVPERPHLYGSLTVAEAMRYHAAFFPTWDQDRALLLRSRLGLPLDRRIGRMSKGEVGKLMMLLALAQRPELLVLDEPTDGLDPMVRRDVLTAVLDYVAEAGATVFISSHLVHELERICDWVGVLDRGRLVAEMPIGAFKRGVKRISVADPPSSHGAPPFGLLSRGVDELALGETWIVRDWEEPMRGWFTDVGASVRDVVDMDLEDVFVELLRSARHEEASR
ncbi:MAG TPA: ABC transporter ATP-binding protein, partial [Thermoanaerobaculia bacterium]